MERTELLNKDIAFMKEYLIPRGFEFSYCNIDGKKFPQFIQNDSKGTLFKVYLRYGEQWRLSKRFSEWGLWSCEIGSIDESEISWLLKTCSDNY